MFIRREKMPNGFYKANFKDQLDQLCLVRETDEKELFIGVSRDINGDKCDKVMLLSREHIIALLPLLRDFLENGSMGHKGL